MARKRTRDALEELRRALDPDDKLDPGLGDLPEELRERLSDAIDETLRAVYKQPVIDGRGAKPAGGSDAWLARGYIERNPPPRGTPFERYWPEATRNEPKKGDAVLITKSNWAKDYVEYMDQHGVRIETAEYLFKEIMKEKRAGRR